nr:retrotransposon protein, putative, Ty1-copia subclass [Tanacetum cinerariifolium]
MESLNPQVVAAAKLPILNPNEFELWKMRIEQYFLMTDDSLWEVILNGDSPSPTRIVDGAVQIIALTTTEKRIVLSIEDKLNYLEQPIPPAYVAPKGQQIAAKIFAAHTAWIKRSKEIEEGQSVSSYVLKMKGYIDNLERFGAPRKVQKVNKHKKPQPQMAARGQNHGKGKNKLAYAPKPKIPPSPKREDPAKDSACHECGETGHWKRNCPRYLAELLKKKKNAALELGLRESRKLKQRAFSFAIPRDGIFEIDLSNSYINESSMYVVSNKRAKLDLDSALLWHCRLRHISKKGIKKLQHDGLLNSTDLRAFEKCVLCMSGNMERKPYTHQMERAKDLLRLIHIDVCGLFKIMSRQGVNYFVTFTDDFGRYGYVYLLKHKHEVFETFKVFQKEVENQLGKTIKSIRSDRKGEYMSQEFLDHLKDHGIITHRTPPYTPQYNGVTERRNRTLLDIVRSMMTSESLEDLEIIQEEDTHPSINTSLNHEENDLEIDEPQSDIIPIHRSTRTHRPTDRMCLYIDAEEHELGDLGEPANYKATLLDPESDKWLNAMNVEI